MNQYRQDNPERKKDREHLQDEGVCDVPFQKKKREREKSQDISKMKDDVILKTQESSNSANKKKRVQKDHHEKSSQDIRLPNLPRILFKFCEILLSIFFHQLLSQYQEYSLFCSYQGN